MSLNSLSRKLQPNGQAAAAWVLVRVPRPDSADKESAWEVTEVQARIGAKPIGFLRICHLSRARYEARFPGRLDKIARTGHHSALKDLEGASLLVLQRALFAGHMILEDNWTKATAVQAQATTEDQARTLVKVMTDRLWDHASTRVQRVGFEEFQLDRPLVEKVEIDPAFQQRGIGRAMYLEAAAWLGEQGLQLHASQIQTPAAVAVWKSLVRDNLAHRDGDEPSARLQMDKPLTDVRPAARALRNHP